MRVDIDYTKFKNIGSYGNNITTVNFKKGNNLISATNGVGKSTIIDALYYCLTGKAYKEVKKIKSIINRFNKKNLYVETGFHVGDTYWKIIRTMKPDNLEYFRKNIDNSEYEKIDSLSSKALDQTEIEKILGIVPFMIKQIITLNASYNKPFLKLSAAESRLTLESIFNLTVFSKMVAETKTLIGSNKVDINLNSKNLTYITNDVTNQTNNLNNMKNIINSFNDDKQLEISKINDTINNYKTNIIEHNENKDACINFLENNKINHSDIQDIANDIQNVSNTVKQYREESNEKTIRINLLNKGQCPTCANKFEGNFTYELELKELIEANEIIKKEIKDNTLTISDLEFKFKNKQEEHTKYKEIEILLNEEITNIKNCENKIINCENDIKTQEDKSINYDITELETKLSETISKQNEIQKSVNNLTKENENLEDVKKILSDNGAKSYLLTKYIPILNNKVQILLDKFGLNFVIHFNELMQVEIIDPKQPDIDCEYDLLSGGEKKRLDIAILFAFMGVIKEICNWNTNLLIIDELFDSGLDADGLEMITNTLQKMIKEDDLSIYTISHRKLPSDLFTGHLNIKKDQYGFSNIISQT